MKNKLFLLTLCVALFGASSCSEDDDTDGSDLTTGIVGNYTNAGTNTNIVVNKIDDTTVSITLTSGSGSGEFSVAFPSATMTSASAFTMDEVTQDGEGCIGMETFSGTGTASNDNISLFMTVVGTPPSPSTPYDCDGTDTINLSASK